MAAQCIFVAQKSLVNLSLLYIKYLLISYYIITAVPPLLPGGEANL